MENQTSRWIVLVQMYLCMLVCVFTMQCIPPILPLIIEHFHLSHHQGGLLMSMFCLPAVVLSLPVGLLADRCGIKAVGTAGLLFAAAGAAIVATADSFAMLMIGRVTTGIGGVIILVVTPQGIAERFHGRQMGLAMGIYNTSGPIGIVVSFNALAVMATYWGWRSSVWASAVFSVLVLVGFIIFFRPPPRESNPQARERVIDGFRSMMRGSSTVWLIASAWGFFNAAFNSFFSFAPDFLVSRGFTLASAAFYSSIAIAVSLVFAPVVGHLSDRVTHKFLLVMAGGVCMAVPLFLLPGNPRLLVVFMASIGLAAAFVATPVYSIAAESVSMESLGFVFGLLSMLNNLAVFIGPQLVGWSRDASGSYGAGFAIMALFAFLVTVLAALTMGKKTRMGAVAPEAPVKKAAGSVD